MLGYALPSYAAVGFQEWPGVEMPNSDVCVHQYYCENRSENTTDLPSSALFYRSSVSCRDEELMK